MTCTVAALFTYSTRSVLLKLFVFRYC